LNDRSSFPPASKTIPTWIFEGSSAARARLQAGSASSAAAARRIQERMGDELYLTR
jgi:hypothetical protein